ncbi:MAG: hypothetical protein R3330_00905, partial [Saprospiraceae bacterium]|nr:hypothetical protein [Saprospiraceae bacterium]
MERMITLHEMPRTGALLLMLSAALLSSCADSHQNNTTHDGQTEGIRPQPEGSPVALGLAGYAKVLCSAVFVSGREPAEAAHNSGYFLLPEPLQDKASYVIDTTQKVVTMQLGDSLTRHARYVGD